MNKYNEIFGVSKTEENKPAPLCFQPEEENLKLIGVRKIMMT
jgi:hypothetical protein